MHDRTSQAPWSDTDATQYLAGDQPSDESTRDTWDVVIIGAGPAGSSAALGCARQGLRVLLVEARRFPRHKVCGGCLNQVSIPILRDLVGAEHRLWNSTSPIRSFQLTHAGRRFAFPTPDGCAIARAELDQHLVEAATQAGTNFQSPAQARLGEIDSNYRRVTIRQNGLDRSIRAKLVVIASGLDNRQVTHDQDLQHTNHPSSRVGVETIYPQTPESFGPGIIHMVVGRHGYVGLTQIAGGRLHVAAAVDKSALQALGPEKVTLSILQEAGAGSLPADDALNWRGTLPLTSRPMRLGAERVLLVGDSAGYVEPFTGEGIRWALQGGVALAGFAEQACRQWSPTLVNEWEAWYASQILNDQRLCRWLSWGLKKPAARWLAHNFLRINPAFAHEIIQRINKKA